jgi:hypothetical protein
VVVKILLIKSPPKNTESSECEDFQVDVCVDAVPAFHSLFTHILPNTYTAKQRGVADLVTLFLLGRLTLSIEPLASSRAH